MKTYTVIVSVSTEYRYLITAKGALKARQIAEDRLLEEHPEYKLCDIKSYAVADWVKKEKQE